MRAASLEDSCFHSETEKPVSEGTGSLPKISFTVRVY